MTDYSDYVHCGEVFRSSILCNEKLYLFKCIKCQDLFQLEAFLTHSEQNICDLREITIKEEVLDDGCLSGCPEKAKNEGINCNSIDEIEVNQVGCLNKDSLVFKKDEDVSDADEKDHVRYKIESSDAEVDAEPQEFETDVSLELGINLTRHMRIHGRNLNDDKTMTCEDKMADTEIIVEDNLNEILYLHTCEMCSKGFYNKWKLTQHLKSHTNVRDYICKTCGKAFKKAHHLRSHEFTHSDVRKYVCRICSKSFKQGFLLTRHLKSHTNVRDYICKTCGKAFKTAHHLRSHEVSHSDLRKYVCRICSKSFKQGFQLTRHMRIHGRNLNDDKTTTSEDKMADTEIIVKDNLN